jgi:hypothetical protein
MLNHLDKSKNKKGFVFFIIFWIFPLFIKMCVFSFTHNNFLMGPLNMNTCISSKFYNVI